MIKKKKIILAALIAMVGLSGYFNWSYQHSENGAVTDTEDISLGEARLVSGSNIKSEKDYFADSRTERDQGKSKAMESLKEVSENPESTATIFPEALP